MKRSSMRDRFVLLVLGLGWSAIVVYGSLVPLRYTPLEWETAIARFANIPYFTIGVHGRDDWVANGLLFAPIGWLLAGALTLDLRGRVGPWIASALVLGLGGALAVGLEFAQLWFPPRTVSLNDIVAEGIGVAVGVSLWRLGGQSAVDWLRSWHGTLPPREHGRRLLWLYLLAMLIYSVMPLDVVVSADELRFKYREGRIDLQMLPDTVGEPMAVAKRFAHLLMFVPAGMWLAWPTRDGQRRYLGAALLAAVGLVALVELAQLLVFTRHASASDLIFGSLGAGLGVLLTRLPLATTWALVDHWLLSDDPSARGLSLTLAGSYALLLCLAFWSPFVPEHDRFTIDVRWQGLFSPPGARLYVGSEFNALNQVVVKTSLFALLGLLLVRAVDRFSAPYRGPALTLSLLVLGGVSLAIEIGQVWLAHGVPDLTDTFLYFAGGLIGMVATRMLQRMLRPLGKTPWSPVVQSPTVP